MIPKSLPRTLIGRSWFSDKIMRQQDEADLKV